MCGNRLPQLTRFDSCNSGNAIGIARALLAACMILTYPMECYVSRHCLQSILKKLRSKSRHSTYDSIQSHSSHSHPGIHSDHKEIELSPAKSQQSNGYKMSSSMFDEMDAMGSMGVTGDELIHQSANKQLLSKDSPRSSLFSRVSLLFRGYASVPVDSPHPKSEIVQTSARHANIAAQESSAASNNHSASDLEFEEGNFDTFVNSPSRTHPSSLPVRTQGAAQYNPMMSDLQPSAESATAGTSTTEDPHAAHRAPTESWSTVVARSFLTLLLWGLSLFIAIVVKDVGIVISLTGAFAAACLGYLLPALIYFATYKPELKASLEGSRLNFIAGWPVIRTWLAAPPASMHKQDGHFEGATNSTVENHSNQHDSAEIHSKSTGGNGRSRSTSNDEGKGLSPTNKLSPAKLRGLSDDDLSEIDIDDLRDVMSGDNEADSKKSANSKKPSTLPSMFTSSNGNKRSNGNGGNDIETGVKSKRNHRRAGYDRITVDDTVGSESEPPVQVTQEMTLKSFVVPAFLVVFGALSMILGVTTVIYEHQKK
jgi:hypothetical protein